MNLPEQGWRFIYAEGSFYWCHPAELPKAHTDCTDMSDEALQAFIDHCPEEDL